MATLYQQQIVPFLWFDNQAEEAIDFYISVFENSKKTAVTYYGKGTPMPEGTVMTVDFELNGQEFAALNGGPHFKFTEAISLYIKCSSQQEIDYYWDKFSAGGTVQQCGWLKDKYGLSWQIAPVQLGQMLQDKDREKANRVLQAMMQMQKIDLGVLERVYGEVGI